MSTWPTHEQIVDFVSGPMDQPVVMLNMLTFKKDADETHAGQSGKEAVMQYSRAMKEFVESHGGTFIIAADIDSQMIGEGGEHFQFIAIMRYPSRQAYIDLAGDPEIADTIGKHRDAGLESQWLFAMTEMTE